MGVAGLVIGTVAGQFSGAWVYRRVRGNSPGPWSEFDAAWAAGLVTTAVASAIYVPLGVHTWALGSDASWGMSVFLALCLGICQGMLFRGRPSGPRAPTSLP